MMNKNDILMLIDIFTREVNTLKHIKEVEPEEYWQEYIEELGQDLGKMSQLIKTDSLKEYSE